MKFEEALTALREGAKIWHPGMPDDEYYMACRVGLVGMKIPTDEMQISIVHMKSGNEHPDMYPQLRFNEQIDLLEKYPFLRDKITFPTINLFLVMSDEWKIIGGIK